jgi:CHAT domain-containing protein
MQRNPRTLFLRGKTAARRSIGRASFLLALTGCAPDPASDLAEALESVPGVAPRLSIVSSFRACSERTPEGGTVPRAHCPVSGRPRTDRISRLAAKVTDMEDEAAAARTLAAMDLVLDDGRGIGIERSISSLRKAADVAERPAPVLADLAAALIVRAERTQAPRDLLEAHETAELALRHEQGNLAALYNRALALDRFGLVDEAVRDWDAYLRADSRSGWADEARRRRQALAALASAARPAADASLDAYARYAAAEPQGTRELGMNRLLAEWAEALEAGDAARAGDRLLRAGALGRALERRPGGDASLADAVRAITAASNDAGATRALARAHREYAAGGRSFEQLDYVRAQAQFTAAAASASPVLGEWARVYIGTLRVYLGDRRGGERMLAEAAGADPHRHPALSARARWSLGRTLGHAERWEAGLEEARESALLFARAGERENEGAALNVFADIEFVLGEPDSAYAALHRALDRLKPYRASTRLNNLMISSADAMAADGLHGAAVRMLGEGVGVATRTRHPVIAAEARLRRARHLATGGDLARAGADLDTVRAQVRKIVSRDARDWLEADLRQAEAVVSLRTDPVRATQALDSTAAYFAGISLPFRALPALVGSAEARLVAGDAPGAVRQLEAAVRLLDQRRDSIRMEPRRAAVFDAARGVVDRIVLLKLAEGRADEALDHMDRARASLAAASRPAAWERGAAALSGETTLEYARIADTLLIWTVAAARVEVARTVIDTARLGRTLRVLEDKLQRGAPEEEVRPALSLLYEWLVRPVEARLAPTAPLVVVADGEIASVPFAALHDARRGRYLVEDHPLRFAVSLREARRKPIAGAADGVLLVADPAFDAREHPLLERLAHARREVRAIAPGYRDAAVLEGGEATTTAVKSALARAGVVHFAGHAVFDDQRPERSYLVLAPAADREAGGKLVAAELAQLDLRHVRLVVLSACRTIRSGGSRAGGFTGLSGALLAAGAGGAVGSTWDVHDRFSAALMTEFHRAYRDRRDGPRALRAAQLTLLRSRDAALRGPAAWAGFRYAGR